jgi:serine/threonine protein phosphatase PrpC
MHQVGGEFGFFLADGLGGHGKGEVASQTAVSQAIVQFEQGGSQETVLKNIFECGQKEILKLQQQSGSSQAIKTTMTALLVGKDQIQWGHLGDSRIYYFQNRKLKERTLDHSVPQMLAMIGEIREKDIRHHPDRNRLLHVMGAAGDQNAYRLAPPIPREGRQAFLLCSDGFWELIDEKKMQRTLRSADTVEEWMRSMETAVVAAGKKTEMDNYSAVAVWIS